MNDKIHDYKMSLVNGYYQYVPAGAKVLINMTFKEYERIIKLQEQKIERYKKTLEYYAKDDIRGDKAKEALECETDIEA
jgi:hypothetical protein